MAATDGIERLHHGFDPDVAGGDFLLIRVVERHRLLQNEQMFSAIMARQRLLDRFHAGMTAFVAHRRQHGRVALSGDDRAENAHAGCSRDVGHDMVKLEIHLRHGLLHMLDLGSCGVEKPFPLAQISAKFRNLALRSKARAQQTVRVEALQPLGVAYVRLAAGDVLGVAGIDEKDLETAFVEQLEYWNPVDACRFHYDRPDAAFRKPIGQPMEVASERAKTLNRIGRAIRVHRRHVHGGANIDSRGIRMDHRHPRARRLRVFLALHFHPPDNKGGRAGLRG